MLKLGDKADDDDILEDSVNTKVCAFKLTAREITRFYILVR